MKTFGYGVVSLTTLLTVLIWSSLGFAFDSGSTEQDGPLIVELGAPPLQLPPDGVFNLTTVHVKQGATLSFVKNEQNTPVTILASGDVLVDGTISVNGGQGNYIVPGNGGPGGFSGGVGGVALAGGRRAEGPAGGEGAGPNTSRDVGGGNAGGGGYGFNGGAGQVYFSHVYNGKGGGTYGNERIFPLIGGSGGGGGGGTSNAVGGSGGGGAGAILIATSGKLVVNGAITANGGRGTDGEGAPWGAYGQHRRGGGGGGGSGGAIRLIANAVEGNGPIQALGGGGGRGFIEDWWSDASWGGSGGKGRIRIEVPTTKITRTVGTDPNMSLGYPFAINPPGIPSMKIISIAGTPVPDSPTGDYGAPDILLPFGTKNPIAVQIEGINIPDGTQVTLKSSPAIGTPVSQSTTLSGAGNTTNAVVEINISSAHPSLLTAFASFDLVAMTEEPLFINGEKIAKVLVSTSIGAGSQVVYVTESGKEIQSIM